MKFMHIALLASLALAGCGSQASPAAVANREAATVEAQGKGKLVLRAGGTGISSNPRREILSASFEGERFFFGDDRPGSGTFEVRVNGQVAAKGCVYPAADGTVYLGDYKRNDEEGDYAVLGTYRASDPARIPFNTKLDFTPEQPLDYFYKREGGIMGHTTFYLIAKQAPRMVRKRVPFVLLQPK